MQEIIYNTNELNPPAKIVPEFEPYTLAPQDAEILGSKIQIFDFGYPNHDPLEIGSRLVETAKLHNSFGVAANQCGERYRVFVAGADENYIAFFNPEIILESEETSLIPETDLSNMGLLLHVKRPKSVTVQFQDLNGQLQTLHFDGLTARIVQQCIDRLNGIGFEMRVSKLVLDRATKALDKKVKKFVKQNTYIKTVRK